MLREKEKTMAKEGVPESQDDDVMSIPLAGLPFHEDDKPSKARTSSNKTRLHTVEQDQPPVMFQSPTPFFNFQNPIAAAAVAAAHLQPFVGTETPFTMPPAMAPAPSLATPLIEPYAMAITPNDLSPCR